MSQIFVISVSVQLYKCMLILFVVMYSFYVWMSDILKNGGVFVAIHFLIPISNLIHLYKSCLTTPFFLSFLHPVLLSIPGIFFLSFYIFLSFCPSVNGLRSPKCISDMELVQNFTPPDFQTKNFTKGLGSEC